jgi:hypothetical protein
MNVYRVTYDIQGRTQVKVVVADSDTAASAFLGIGNDVPAQVVQIAKDAEVVGKDAPHSPVAPAPVTVAPFDLPKTPSIAAFNALQAQVADLQKQMALKNTPASPAPQS